MATKRNRLKTPSKSRSVRKTLLSMHSGSPHCNQKCCTLVKVAFDNTGVHVPSSSVVGCDACLLVAVYGVFYGVLKLFSLFGCQNLTKVVVSVPQPSLSVDGSAHFQDLTRPCTDPVVPGEVMHLAGKEACFFCELSGEFLVLPPSCFGWCAVLCLLVW